MSNSSPAVLASQWLRDFGAALERNDLSTITELFNDECYWRDLLTFTWNIKTLEGQNQINDMLTAVLADVNPGHWCLQSEAEVHPGLQDFRQEALSEKKPNRIDLGKL